MRKRVIGAALALAALAVAAVVVLAGLSGPDRAATEAGQPPPERTVVDGPWTPPDLLGDGWSAGAPKSTTLDFVPDQGGLWRLQVPYDGGGELSVVPGSDPAPDQDAAQLPTVRIIVEVGLGVDSTEFAHQVMSTLNDPRGWGHDGSVSFARTDGEADIDVTLASPATTDELCYPVDTGGTVSCGRVGFAVLNAVRWAEGAEPFLAAGGTLEEYRYYLVNHEVGHVIGNGHVPCPAPGAVAPIMLQQTLTLDGCQPNGWPANGT